MNQIISKQIQNKWAWSRLIWKEIKPWNKSYDLFACYVIHMLPTMHILRIKFNSINFNLIQFQINSKRFCWTYHLVRYNWIYIYVLCRWQQYKWVIFNSKSQSPVTYTTNKMMESNVLINFLDSWECCHQRLINACGFFYLHLLTLILTWISNYVPRKVWGEITYPFLNFNGATVEVWE